MNQEYFDSKFMLTSDQLDLYLWLKEQGINTDDATLNYWSKKYSKKRINDVINFAKKRMASGQQIRNFGGWIHALLIKGIPVEDDQCRANRDHAKRYSSEKKWHDLKIYEKYVKDKVTGDDISLTISQDTFVYALKSLHNRHKMYKESFRS